MEDDAKVVLMGEDIGKLGGVFRITDGLQKDFGEDRVVDTPLAEAGILGTAVGLAMRGYRPVCEIQFDGFVFPAYNQIVTQVAKIHARSKGVLPMPIVIRIPFGGGIGAVEHHSESPEAYFAHTPGLKVVAVSNPVDAYWGIQQAIAHPDPIVFLEPKRRYWEKAEVDTDATPEPLFRSRVVRGWRRRHRAGLRPDGEDGAAGRRGRRGGGPVARGDRPAHRLAARPRPGLRVRPPHRPLRRRPRGRRDPRPRRGDRRPRDRELLPLAGGAGAARRRLRHPVPAVEAGRGVPARPGPGARRRRPLDGVLSMATKQFKLPDVGEGLTEGEILQWLVAVGDTVTVNQPLCEVETAKAAVELPSPYAGTVTELLFDAGTMVDVGTPIITIDVGGDGGGAAALQAPRPRCRRRAGRRPDRRRGPGRPDRGAGRLRPAEHRGPAPSAAHAGRPWPRGRPRPQRRPARGRLRLRQRPAAAAGHRARRRRQAGAARRSRGRPAGRGARAGR